MMPLAGQSIWQSLPLPAYFTGCVIATTFIQDSARSPMFKVQDRPSLPHTVLSFTQIISSMLNLFQLVVSNELIVGSFKFPVNQFLLQPVAELEPLLL